MSDIDSSPEEIELIMESKTNIMTSISNDEPYTAINEMDLLLKMMPEEFKKKHKLTLLEKKLKNFLLNKTNNRILRLNQRVKLEVETAIEYYDKDIGEDPRLLYNKLLEEDILKIQDEIREALGTILKSKLSGEIDFN